LEGLDGEIFGIFYDHLVYFRAIGNILWPFVIFCGNLEAIFSRFGMLYREKSGNPALGHGLKSGAVVLKLSPKRSWSH
jgi:hypothetical protein